jgi:hypothetical protein
MRESFSEYKSIIEKNIISIPYLYDGDVDFSTQRSYSKITNRPFTSPQVIIDTIINIYNESIEHVKNKSRDVVISEESLKFTSGGWSSLDTNKLMYQISLELGSNPKYIFTTKKSYHKCGFDNKFELDNKKPFPGYFYTLTRLTGLNTDILYSPLVDDNDNEFVLYVVDKSFQSIVYSIQNMEYNIKMFDNDIKHNKPYNEIEWIHKIDYNFYYCKFTALKVVIKNISKLRDDKINLILNGD